MQERLDSAGIDPHREPPGASGHRGPVESGLRSIGDDSLGDTPNSESRDWLKPVSLVLLAGAGVLYLKLLAFRSRHQDFDDAYMFARYAHHLTRGRGFAWNPDGVQTYGPTSLLYVLVVAAFHALVPPLGPGPLVTVASGLLGLGALALLVLTVTKNARSEALRAPAVAAAFIVAPLIFQQGFLFHATTGMDTTLAILCNTTLILSVLSYVKAPSPRALAGMCASSWLSFAARPDDGIYALAFPTLYLALHLPTLRHAARFLPIALALFGLDALAKRLWFGSPFPLSMYVKSGVFYEGYVGAWHWNPIEYLFFFAAAAAPFLAMIVLGARRTSLRTVVAFLLPVALTFLYYFRVTQVMGFSARYYFPGLPFVVVAGVLVLDEQLLGARIAGARPPLTRGLLSIAIFAAAFGFADPIAKSYAFRYLGPKAAPEVTLVEGLPRRGWDGAINAVSRIVQRLPQEAVIAASEVGYLGAAAPELTIVDLAGLNDSTLARKGFSAAYVESRRPDLIWMPHSEYMGLNKALLASSELAARYDYYPGAFDYGLAVRKDTPLRSDVMSAVQAIWQESYPGTDMASHRRELR
jgi:hypothetical protein